jgi:multiple sugar transport system substrate-binding protein
MSPSGDVPQAVSSIDDAGGGSGTDAGPRIRARVPASAPTRRRALRALAAAASVPALAALVAGCRSQEDAGAAPKQEPVVHLTYLHQWSQNQGHGPATDELTARFREQFPTVQIEPVYTADYSNKLTTIVAGGDLPDVATSNTGYLLSLARKQVLVSPETLSKGQFRYDKNDLIPASRDMVTFDGKQMAMPYILSNQRLAYNQTLFKQAGLDPARAPATWDDLVEAGRRLTGGSGDAERWGVWIRRGTGGVPVGIWQCFLWQAGGTEVNVERREATWNSPAGIEALQFWVDLIHKYRVAALDVPANPHLSGRVAIWVLPTGDMSIIEKAVGDQFQWTTAVLPKHKQAASNVGGHALLVMKTEKYHEQAWRFVQWFTSPKNVVEFNIRSTTLPPWKSAQQEPAWQRYAQEQPRIKPFVEELAYGHPPPKLSTWDDVQAALWNGIDSALTLKQAPKQALDEAARVAQPLLAAG